jgi:DNA-binding PadR family transcriptional regulator
VILSWASTKVDVKQWSFEIPGRLGQAKKEATQALPSLLKAAWRQAKMFSEGRAIKEELALLSACWDAFESPRVKAGDESAPFDRPGYVFVDIDLSSRNEALTLKERIREALPPENRYPLSLSPSGDGIKLMIPVAIGKGVPWNNHSRPHYCRAILDNLLGDLARDIKVDPCGPATSRAFLSEDILHELVGEDGRMVTPLLIEASSGMDSLFGEKRPSGEFPTIVKWKLAPISAATFQAIVQYCLDTAGCGRRLSGKDNPLELAANLGEFLDDNNPQILSWDRQELLFEDHLKGLTEIQRAAIWKTGSGLFLKQLRGLVAVMRFLASSRRWGSNAPRSVKFISHGLAQCNVEIHPSRVDALLKKLVDAGLLERTREHQRGRTPAWYQLTGPAIEDFKTETAATPRAFDQPQNGQWNDVMIRRVWFFKSAESWLEHVLALPGIHAKADRLRKCVDIWNCSARKRDLESIDFSNLPGTSS